MLKDLLKTILLWMIMLLLFYPITFLFEEHGEPRRDAMELRMDLQSLDSQKVSEFRIFPRTSRPVNTPLAFRVSDPMIEDFFHALADLSTYRYNHDTVKSSDYTWCLEIVAENSIFPIKFHIPTGRGNIAVGELGQYRTGGAGYFQSRQLYQWYQKYRHRWLEPEKL